MRTKHYIILLLAASLALAAQAQTLGLEQCKQMAVDHNMALRTANYQVRQAQEQRREAFTKYFPTVSATGLGFKSSDGLLQAKLATGELTANLPTQFAGLLPDPLEINLVDGALLGGVQAVQPVFAGGRIVNSNRLAQVGVEVKELQRDQSRNTVLLTAEQYYWQVVTVKEKLRTLDAVQAMLKSLEGDAQVFLDAGVGLKNDLLQVQLRQTEVQSNRVKLDNALKLSKMLLGQYIGLEGTGFDVQSDADPQAMPSFPQSLKLDHGQAVKTTPEYQLLEKNVEASRLQTRLERGKLMPSIGVGVGYNASRINDAHMTNSRGMVFATVSVPLSDWWGGSHAVKRRQLEEQNAREQLADRTQLLEINMQREWNDVEDSYKQLQLARKAIEQSQENLRLNTDYYHAGTVQMTDVLDAQQQYQQSCDRYVDAFAQFHTCILAYKLSTAQD